jgi:SAM-dependent methyltransferase
MKSSALLDQFNNWKNGLSYEVAFWDRWLANKGGRYKDDYENRLNASLPVDFWMAKLIDELNVSDPSILDVGAGPISCLGKIHSGKPLSITACDPLAPFYATILAKHSVRSPILTEFACAEDIAFTYERESFDIVHCQNALDHSFDPLRGIWQMLAVCKTGGFILLRHAHNEAENEGYAGFHQWNMTTDNGEFVIWNRSERIVVDDVIGDAGQVRIELEDGYCIVSIRKKSDKLQESYLDCRARGRELLELFVHLASEYGKESTEEIKNNND